MLATRCKLRWPGAVATVGLRCISQARPRIGVRARCLGTTASPDGVKDEHKKKGHGFSSRRLPLPNRHSFYRPRAYKPEPLSYADILGRVIYEPLWRSAMALKQVHGALQPGERFRADETSETSGQPAESPLPLEHVLGRSLMYLTKQSEMFQAVVSAVSRDLSSHLVPEGYTHDPAAVRAHHLGRWYADATALKVERGHIKHYLHDVAGTTGTAGRIITSAYNRIVLRTLSSHKAAVNRAIEQHRREFEAVVHFMACEVRIARLSGQWHKVWTLERKLASTVSMFLPSRPLATANRTFFNRDDERMTEISMSRMAEWNDSYKSLYEDDVYTRERMNLAKRYWAVFNSPEHERPWQGNAVIFTARSPISSDKEYIILRHDQSSPPAPLWPRVWKPVVRDDMEIPAGSNSPGSTTKITRKTIQTPRETGKKEAPKEETDKDSGSKGQQQASLGMHADSDISEA